MGAKLLATIRFLLVWPVVFLWTGQLISLLVSYIVSWAFEELMRPTISARSEFNLSTLSARFIVGHLIGAIFASVLAYRLARRPSSVGTGIAVVAFLATAVVVGGLLILISRSAA